MSIRHAAGLLAAAVVCVSGCSSQEQAPTSPAGDGATASAAPAVPAVLKLGQSADITGENGKPLKVTPLGVYYYRGKPGDPTLPQEKWFAAVAIKVEATTAADRASGSMWRVKQGTRLFDTGTGKAPVAPWVGSVNSGVALTDPGDPEIVIQTFDLPAGGGVLQWATTDKPTIRWQLPGRNSGQGLDEVVAFLKNQ